jgi:hypothetical protein
VVAFIQKTRQPPSETCGCARAGGIAGDSRQRLRDHQSTTPDHDDATTVGEVLRPLQRAPEAQHPVPRKPPPGLQRLTARAAQST